MSYSNKEMKEAVLREARGSPEYIRTAAVIGNFPINVYDCYNNFGLVPGNANRSVIRKFCRNGIESAVEEDAEPDPKQLKIRQLRIAA
ncbi:MAG: hypothetical protein CMH64_00405 [Nanoarchaeota archaeon]|nr:hypothetical protein [Nanoarchaeota archaeon]|tara:strand:+ start:1336 stop:1599 length:264 start_codon:yes stop_codon:yes gene_type:complete